MISPSRLRQGREIGVFLIVVVVGHGDEQGIAQAGPLQHQGLQGPGRSPVAIEKGVHGCEMIVQRQGLNQRIVLQVRALRRLDQLIERLSAFGAALRAPVPWGAECHILICAPELAGRAVVIVRVGHDQPMQLFDQIAVNGLVVAHSSNPAISLDRGSGLPLRTGESLRRRFAQRRFKLALRKVRPLDPRSSGHFALELDGLQLLHPTALIGQAGKRRHPCLRFHQRSKDRLPIVPNPVLRHAVLNHGFVSASFSVHFNEVYSLLIENKELFRKKREEIFSSLQLHCSVGASISKPCPIKTAILGTAAHHAVQRQRALDGGRPGNRLGAVAAAGVSFAGRRRGLDCGARSAEDWPLGNRFSAARANLEVRG